MSHILLRGPDCPDMIVYWQFCRKRGVYELRPAIPKVPQPQMDARYRASHEVGPKPPLIYVCPMCHTYTLVDVHIFIKSEMANRSSVMQHFDDHSMDATVQAVRQKLEKV